MDKETEIKVVKFIRTVAISGIEPNMCNDALDLLLEINNGTVKLGVFKILPTEYHTIVEFLKDDKKIQAIKELRRITGAGLKESKDAVDEWLATHPEETNFKDNIPF